MDKIKVSGLPGVEKDVWERHKDLIAACRLERTKGFKDGDASYEVAFDSLKRHASDHNLLLGHVCAIEQEYARDHP